MISPHRFAQLATRSNVSLANFARLVLAGREPRLLRGWLSGRQSPPNGLIDWAVSVKDIDVDVRPDGSARVVIEYEPFTVNNPSRPRADDAGDDDE
jgi:hypothetical protein